MKKKLSMTDSLLFTQEGAIVTLTLNQPETRNALSTEMLALLIEAIERINSDLSVSCMVLTGAGKGFCSGGNINDIHERTGFAAGGPASIRQAMINIFQRLPRAFQSLEVPSIAAVNGAAYGGGMDIALMCDMRIASKDAVFSQSFIRLGLLSADGGAWYLPRIVGTSLANEICLTGDPIDALTAVNYRMVSRVVENDQLLNETYRLAGRITAHPPHTVRATKRLLQQSSLGSLDQSLDLAAALQATLYHTKDHEEAVGAFIERRVPSYKGE